MPTKRTIKGTVVRRVDPHTVVVEVVSEERHPKYLKRYRSSKRYLAHTAKDTKAEAGVAVTLVETRPRSRRKRWSIQP